LVIGNSGGGMLTGDSSAYEATAALVTRAKLHLIQRKAG
jgi:hypothetical protein